MCQHPWIITILLSLTVAVQAQQPVQSASNATPAVVENLPPVDAQEIQSQLDYLMRRVRELELQQMQINLSTQQLQQEFATTQADVQLINHEMFAPPATIAPGPKALEAKKYPNVTINGVFQADAGFFEQDAASIAAHGNIQDGVDFRRARLSAKGSVTETVNYMMQMDFAAFGRPTFTDLWLEQTQLPILGNWRIGQWKQPFSLEAVSSFRYTTFMERSVLFQPFVPFRHIGTGFYNHNDSLTSTWAVSVFRTGQDQFGGSISDDGGWGTAERFTMLPYWCEPGTHYLHLGVGHFYNAPPRDTVNFRTIPEYYVGENAPGVVGTSGQAAPGAFNGTPFFIATGPLAVAQYNVFGSDLMWVRGPLSFQSEAMVNYVQQENGIEATLPGAYAQVGYFLTGEHRPYDRATGAIDRVKPFTNFQRCGGPGGWEVAFRWSYLDLNDKNIAGGSLTDYTTGVNWYWNPYTKIVFNYINATSDQPVFGETTTHIYAMRAQIDF